MAVRPRVKAILEQTMRTVRLVKAQADNHLSSEPRASANGKPQYMITPRNGAVLTRKKTEAGKIKTPTEAWVSRITGGIMQKVIVLDFGAQYGQLIARRVRDLNVYSEILPCDTPASEIAAENPSAIILSGGPASVYADDAPELDPAIFELGLPILGFCYGQQIMAKTLGGIVGHTEIGEYGPATITRFSPSRLLEGTPDEQTVWMSHRDSVTKVPDGFVITSSTDVCPVASMECAERNLYATQFHPEVRHSVHGEDMLSNFLFDICGLIRDWDAEGIADILVSSIRNQVGSDRVILGLSGGVDSSVVAALCARNR